MTAPSSERQPRRSWPRRLVRIVLKTFLTILVILLIIFILIQTPFVQDFARGKIESYLSRKLRVPVHIGHLDIQFFRSVTIRDLYIPDRQRDTLLSAGFLQVRLRMLGLLHNDLEIQEIRVQDLTAKILRRSPADTTFNYQFIIDAFAGKPSPTPDTTKGTPMHIAMNTLLLDNIRFLYADTLTGNTALMTIGHSHTDMRTLNPTTQRYDVAAFDLQRSSLFYRNSGTGMVTSVRLHRLGLESLELDLNKLAFQTQSLRLDSADLAFDNVKQPRLKKGMDYSHLLTRDITLHGEDLAYTADSISGHISRGELSEQSGFRLDQLQTSFFYSNHKTTLHDLLLRTPGTLLQRSVTLQYDSLAAITTHPAHTLVTLDLPSSHVQLKDILLFAPFLASQPVFRHPADTWQINAAVHGSLDDLQIPTLQFSGIQDIRLDMAGRLSHPMDNRRIRADLTIRRLSGSRSALVALLPKNTLPNSIAVPARYNLHGHLAGGMDDMASNLVLNTSSGDVSLQGTARNFRSTTGATYDLALRTRTLDLGTILRDSVQYGAVTASFHVKGAGLDLHSANAVFTASLQSATFRQYTYHGLLVDGSLANEQAVLHSTINDTAVHFELQASAGLAKKFPALKLDWNIDTLDLHALHFVKDTLQFKGHLLAGFENTNPDSLQGSLTLANGNLLRGSQRLATDSIVLTAVRQQDIEDIKLRCEMADIDWKGRYKVTETATALQHTLNQYYHLAGFKDTAFTAQDWTMDIHLRPSPLVLTLMPSLRGTDTLGGRISFNSDHNDLRLGMKTPRIVLGALFLHDIDLTALTADSALRYTLTFADGHGSGLLFHRTSLFGGLKKDQLATTLLLQDENGKDRFRIAGILDEQTNAMRFRLDPDSLLLNYDQWLVSRDNEVRYDSTGPLVHHLVISHDQDSLALNTAGTTGAAPLDVRFADFRLSTLSRLANQDSVIADGILSGNAEVKNLTTNPIFTSDLLVRNLAYKVDTLGDLTLKVNNQKANAFSADISLQGKNNDINVTGDYFTGESRMDLKLDLRQINLAAFAHTAKGFIDDMKGRLRGQMSITGTMDKPNVRGNLYFDSTVITPTLSGEPLKVSNDRIAFDEDGFNFSEFTMQDSAGNKLVLDGNVFTKDYHDFAFDISLNANNFRLVNAPEASDRQFYGQLNVDAAFNLEGKMASPAVDGDLRFNPRTNFYFVVRTPDPTVVDRQGIVRFIDHRTGDTLADRKAVAIHGNNSEIKGVDVSINIETDSNAVFTVVVDENSGDALSVRGRSDLVFGMEKSGKTDLTGSYEVESGYYNLSFNYIKRQFAIDRGSTITWTGDPLSANVDLTASYTANTPSIDLIANQFEGRPESDIIKFRQKLPFLVTLKLSGDLMKPSVNFDIGLPPNLLALWPDVDTRLQQVRNSPSELNKQVFALLLLNRFVGEDPLQSQAGGGSSLGNLAFQTASQIVTSQLDQLAASLIKPVQINFNIYNQQDFSTNREIDYTELNVMVSKHLFTDRVVVSVGSSFDVVGSGAPNQAPSNLAGNVAVDYKLTKDGRYRLRGYRQNQYEAVVLGQVIESGLSFILRFDYDKLKEFFRKAKEARLQERTTSRKNAKQ